MALTTSIHLSKVIISLAGNSPTNVIAGSSGSIGGGGAKTDSRSLEGEFRTYANGVVRLLTGTGTSHVLTFALRALPPADLTALHSFVGKVCLFRDTAGRRFYGSFLVTDETTIPLSGAGTSTTVLTDVGLAITEVNYTEGV